MRSVRRTRTLTSRDKVRLPSQTLSKVGLDERAGPPFLPTSFLSCFFPASTHTCLAHFPRVTPNELLEPPLPLVPSSKSRSLSCSPSFLSLYLTHHNIAFHSPSFSCFSLKPFFLPRGQR